MCRFLLVKSQTPIFPQELILKFAKMSYKSRAPDGDIQGDGWGFAYLNPKDKWITDKSLNSIWDDTKTFSRYPKSQIFTVHARSAMLKSQKNTLRYNQPYVNKKYCYVFNGFLRGVSLKENPEGEIGAQKIWSLLRKSLKKDSEEKEALRNTKDILEVGTKKLCGLNIGLANKESIAALCYHQNNHQYYTLYYFKNAALKIICSEPLEGFGFKKMHSGDMIQL